MYLGDFPTSAAVYFHWNTCDQTGASITRSTDGTLKIYKDGSTTERTSLSGVTQTEDFDSATGVHYVKIDLSDNTDAGFYAAGHEYSVVMTGMVIDTKTVNAHLASFAIERAGGALALLKSVISGAGVNVTQLGGGTQSLTDLKDFADDGYDPSTNKVQGVVLTDTLTTYTGNTPQTGDSYARIGAAGSGLTTLATASALATVQADTDDLQTRLPAALTAGGNIKADALLLNGATPNNLAATAIVSAGAITTSGGKVSGVILTDTVTTYTGNTPQTGDVYPLVDTEVAAIKAKTDLLPASPAAVGSAMTLTSGERTSIADALRARQLTEGYAADGVAPTLEQAVFMIMQGILEFGIVGTALTTRKLDKGTSAMVHTLDSSTAPTSRTRAS